MSDPTVTCPECGHAFPLTQSLAAPAIAAARVDFEERLALKVAELADREIALESERELLREERLQLGDAVDARVAKERARIAEEEERKARNLLKLELEARDRVIEAARELIDDREERLSEAQAAQAEALRLTRELEDARRELELTIERRVQDVAAAIRQSSREEVDGEFRLRLRERDEQIGALQTQINALQRRAEIGSQQLQGEVLELQLEDLLRARFPHDGIQPVGKGRNGADLVQHVRSSSGQDSGSIVWETKRTAGWNDGWLAKLRQDQRDCSADLAILVTQALPKGFSAPFDFVGGVWVCRQACAIPVAVALREALIGITSARSSRDGFETKAELVLDYITGARFRHRISAVVERFLALKADLDRERRALTRGWANREEQLNRALDDLAGLFGDLQGIAGSSLEPIELLGLPAPFDAAQLEAS